MIENYRCPLCKGLVEYEFSRDREYKHVICGKCTEFVITVDAEKQLLSPPVEAAMSADMAAKSDGENFLLIQTGEGNIRKEFISREKIGLLLK